MVAEETFDKMSHRSSRDARAADEIAHVGVLTFRPVGLHHRTDDPRERGLYLGG